ncbi:MAG TPA: DUF6114 domain-containing protein [Candidatus Bathyarchaeia archaeon]|nr:DUF6114 domain-containing protein [Candidatus Bathyarchaeia archaeon]
MSHDQRPVAASVLGLISGVFILLGSLAMSIFTFGAMSLMTGMMNMSGLAMMSQVMSFAPLLAVLGLVSGATVVLSSIMLYQRPNQAELWSAIVLGFSVLSLIGAMGGFMVGLVLGIVGGVLGLTWTPAPRPP